MEIIKISEKKYLNFMPHIKAFEIQWIYKNKEYKTMVHMDTNENIIKVANEHIKKDKDGEFCSYSGKVVNSKIAKRNEIEMIKDQMEQEILKREA